MRRIDPSVMEDLIFCCKDLGFDIASITTCESEYGPPTVDLKLGMVREPNGDGPKPYAQDPETAEPIPENAKMQTLDDDAITQ